MFVVYSSSVHLFSTLRVKYFVTVARATGTFEVFVMYSNSVHSFSTLRVKYFVTVATYGVITHLLKPVLKGNQKGPC